MNGGHFVDTITHWTVWHWPSIKVSTVSNDDVVVHKTYCFDLDLSLMLWKVINNLDGCSTKHQGIRLRWSYLVNMGNIDHYSKKMSPDHCVCQPRWLSGLRRSRVHSLMIARRSLCPEKLWSNPGQGSKGINFSGWHGLDMSITVTKRRLTPTNQTLITVSLEDRFYCVDKRYFGFVFYDNFYWFWRLGQ